MGQKQKKKNLAKKFEDKEEDPGSYPDKAEEHVDGDDGSSRKREREKEWIFHVLNKGPEKLEKALERRWDIMSVF